MLSPQPPDALLRRAHAFPLLSPLHRPPPQPKYKTWSGWDSLQTPSSADHARLFSTTQTLWSSSSGWDSLQTPSSGMPRAEPAATHGGGGVDSYGAKIETYDNTDDPIHPSLREILVEINSAELECVSVDTDVVLAAEARRDARSAAARAEYGARGRSGDAPAPGSNGSANSSGALSLDERSATEEAMQRELSEQIASNRAQLEMHRLERMRQEHAIKHEELEMQLRMQEHTARMAQAESTLK